MFWLVDLLLTGLHTILWTKITVSTPVSARKFHRTTCPAMRKYLSDRGDFCLTCPAVRRTFVNTDIALQIGSFDHSIFFFFFLFFFFHFIKGILFSLFILINAFFFVINILCRYELIRSMKLSVKIFFFFFFWTWHSFYFHLSRYKHLLRPGQS